MNASVPTRLLRVNHTSLLTRQTLADLLDVTPLTVIRWQADKKLCPVSYTDRGAPLFSFEHLAVALREIIGLGIVPTLAKRRKRGVRAI